MKSKAFSNIFYLADCRAYLAHPQDKPDLGIYLHEACRKQRSDENDICCYINLNW